MGGPIDGVLALHNAFRRDIDLIDAAALDSARGSPGLEATVERFRFFNEVLEWHAQGEDSVISPLLESVAPDVYATYERDHRALDDAFDALNKAVSVHDPLETARATKAFKFHLDLHLDKEDAHMYRLIGERVSLPAQGRAIGEMASGTPQDRFPEVVAWMFPLMGQVDRVAMTRAWQMGMPPQGFAMAATLIEQAVGDDWSALTHDVPELVGRDVTQQLVADPSNAGQVDAWDGSEGAFWTARARRFDETLASCHGPFLAAAGVRGDDHVLDVGCGTGQATRDVARIATSGSTLGVDLSSRMIAWLEQPPLEGLDNVEFRASDAQIHPFERGGFDAVISRMGSMFFGDRTAAFANIHRAMRPRGRLTLLTWQGLGDNEWLTEFRAAMAVGRVLPTPPPDVPGPFALADPDVAMTILGAAGFADISFDSLHEPISFGPDPKDAFDFVSELTGWMREGLDESDRDAALRSLHASMAEHTGEHGVTYRSATWIIQARAV